MKWSFEEDYIVCKFYLSHIDSFMEHIDELMEELASAGFGARKRASAVMRIHNFVYLHTGEGLSNFARQSKTVYETLINRSKNNTVYTNLQLYISKNYVCDEDLNSDYDERFTNGKKNTTDFIYTEPLGPTFQEVLFNLIDERNMKDSEVYNACFVGRDTFSHIRKGDKGVSKRTVRQLCFGLKLNYEEAVSLMESAGYAFSKNNLTDVIVAYYLQNNIYDIFDANATLYENQAELLFSA